MRLSVLGLILAMYMVSMPALAQERAIQVEQGRQLFFDQGCFGCHMVGKVGTPIGPNLSEVGAKYPPSYLVDWLRDPAMQKPTAHMPKLDLTEEEIQALATYLSTLR